MRSMILGLAWVFLAQCSLVRSQGFELRSTPLQVGQAFTVSVEQGPPGQFWHLGVDVTPGPVLIPGIGSFALGFTPGMVTLAWMTFDGSGAGSVVGAVSAVPSYIGHLVYAQAACAHPGTPSGTAQSNGVARGFHPALPVLQSAMQLPLSDDAAMFFPLPFAQPFPFFGGNYTQVGISSNGLLTFGGLSIDPTEQVSDFVFGLPKIALLWDDLSPAAGTGIFVDGSASYFRIRFVDVPQFYVPDSNWATVVLYPNGMISFVYEQVDLLDSLIGVSPGGALGAPTAVDFQCQPATGSGALSLYEQFQPATAPFDLAFDQITFLREPATGGYRWIR